MTHPLFAKHQDLLASAVHATQSRGYWTPYAESPRQYGDGALENGREAFEAYRDAQFYLDQPGVVGRGGGEESPYGFALNVSYPKCAVDALLAAGKAAMPAWIKAGPDTRAGVCAEILARLNAHAVELAYTVMHTTGQPFAAAFQTGAVQAQERGLEAVAVAWREMKSLPYRATWEKPQSGAPLRLEKRYTVVPRGVSLNIACATTPTWNGYPGLFSSLATGNAVIVKPHPAAILPLAITVAAARQTLKDAGFDANLVSLLVDTAAAPATRDIALKPDVRLIDYTGGADFGNWLVDNAKQARVFAEKTALNCVVVDSTDNYIGLLKNLTFALSLSAGQMCAAPRVILVPRDGVRTSDGVVAADQFGRDLANAIGKLLEEPSRAVEILGAIQSPATLDRIEAAADLGDVLRESVTLAHPHWPGARIRTPLLVKARLDDTRAWMEERFGPIAFVVETGTATEGLAVAERVARERGAINLTVHSQNRPLLEMAEEAAMRVGVALAINPVGGAVVTQSAAFADFHGSGANPAATACIVDAAYVSSRYFVAQVTHPAA